MGPRICIFNKFSGDADVAGLGPHFENHCIKVKKKNRLWKNLRLVTRVFPHIIILRHDLT